MYWKKRFEMLEDARNKTAMGTVQSVTPAFDLAQAQIEKEINAWYGRFAKNNQISLLEAKKLLNSRELKEFHWDVQEYIKYGRQNAIDQKWMKELENASARFHISRLEALKIRTQNAAERAFGNELDALDEMAARIYMDDYYHTAYEIQKGLGIGFDVSQIDERKLNSILSKPWTADNNTFKDRVWKQKTSMVSELHNQMTRMCILGKSPDEAIKELMKYVDKDIANKKMAAGRLVMTEAAYFGSVAQKDCFNDLGVEKYEIVATLDSRTSDTCRKFDGKIADMKDFQAGVTAPPFHVWCRSCTAPWFPDNDGERVARGADGKTYKVPANMKYEEWEKKFVGDASKKGLKEVSPKRATNTKTFEERYSGLKSKKAEVNDKLSTLKAEKKKVEFEAMTTMDPDAWSKAKSLTDKVKSLEDDLEVIQSEMKQLQGEKAKLVSEYLTSNGICEKVKLSDVMSVDALQEVQDSLTDIVKNQNMPPVKAVIFDPRECGMRGCEAFYDFKDKSIHLSNRFRSTSDEYAIHRKNSVENYRLYRESRKLDEIAEKGMEDALEALKNAEDDAHKFWATQDYQKSVILKNSTKKAVPDTLSDIIVHEYGHHLHFHVTGHEDMFKKTPKLFGQKTLKSKGFDWNPNNLSGKVFASEVSAYATESPLECFAESYTAYRKGIKLPAELEELIKTAIKEVGGKL